MSIEIVRETRRLREQAKKILPKPVPFYLGSQSVGLCFILFDKHAGAKGKIMRKINLLIMAGGLIFALPCYAGQITDLNSILTTSMATTSSLLISSTTKLLGTFCLIQFFMTNWRHITHGSDIEKVVAKAAGSLGWFGICAWVMDNGGAFIKTMNAGIWADDGSLKAEWRDLIVSYPNRFLSALDLGGDRLNRIVEYDQKHRKFLSFLPRETQHRVAYRNAWLLLFGEEFQ